MSRQLAVRILVLAVLAGGGVWLYQQYGDLLTLQSLAAREQQLRQIQADHPLLTFGGAFLIYVTVTGLSLPGATVLTLAYGWYFGMAKGLLLVSFASTAGATLAFLLSRFLLNDMVRRRFGKQLASIDEALRREGAFYLFSLRLIPAVPFFVINVVMGLTPISTFTYWWVSQLGMLPGTVVYVFVGSQVPDLATLAERGVGGILTPSLMGGLVLLALFPLAVRWIMKSAGWSSDAGKS